MNEGSPPEFAAIADRYRVDRELGRGGQRFLAEIRTTANLHVITGPGNIFGARTSPDGNWIAWESDATGRREIYLGPRAGTATPLRVSKAGGGSPRWSRRGRELLYMSGDGHIVSVSVQLPPNPGVYSMTLVQGWQRRFAH